MASKEITPDQPKASKEVAVAESRNYAMAGVWADSQSFALATEMAKRLAGSTLVPLDYQAYPVLANGGRGENRNAVSNCLIAIDMAANLKVSPLMVMQNVDIIHGRPGMRGKFLLALLNACGQFERIRYEWKGEKGDKHWGCRAYARDLKSGDMLYGAWIDMIMVNAEGWNKKSGSKWLTMPEQMFMYRSAAFFERAHAPDVSLGLYTVEELTDIIDVTPSRSSGADLTERIKAEMAGEDAPAFAQLAASAMSAVDLAEQAVAQEAVEAAESADDNLVAERRADSDGEPVDESPAPSDGEDPLVLE